MLDALEEKTRLVETHLKAIERDAAHLLALRFRAANSALLPAMLERVFSH